MSRLEAYKGGKVFYTSDMIDSLQTATGVPEELGEAFLGAWMGIIYHNAFLHAEQSHDFLGQLQENKVQLYLSAELIPAGWYPGEQAAWSPEAFWRQIAQETGLEVCTVQSLLHNVYAQLIRVSEAKKAFEPLGWVQRGAEGMLIIYCWPDLLQPLSDDPEALLLGTF